MLTMAMAIRALSSPGPRGKRVSLGGAGRSAGSATASSGMPQPRIDVRVDEVRAEVDQHVGGCYQQDAALDQRVIALQDRVDQHRPDAGPGKYGLDVYR